MLPLPTSSIIVRLRGVFMLKTKARWKIEKQNEEAVNNLVSSLNISPLVARLLLNRGLDTVEAAKKFLDAEHEEVYDPFLLDGMSKAVDRIEEAIAKNEKILIYGDYDADGVSSTSVMIYTLREKKANFDYYIPNRFTEGYGPNEKALRWAKEQGYELIVTVDTGISAVHEAEVAKEIGLDLIVTDHHEAPPVLPNAYCIINPKKPNCPYPFKGLAGVGVAFKVSHALLGRVPVELLDIVTIGTISDLVPLVSENRLFVKKGLKVLHQSKKPGILAIKKVCSIDSQLINEEHVGFAIGPRINAAGRLESADPAVELLTTDNVEEAFEIASYINELNKNRQELVNDMALEAINEVESLYPPEQNDVLIVAKEGWNAGVIGIVASRLVERFYRPTIVMSIDKEKGIAKGSARSIEGFDMFKNLSFSRDILPHFGGHPMAAGLTMGIDDIDLLRSRLNKQAKETLTAEDFIPIQKIDIVTDLKEISLEVIEELDRLSPFGVGNPTPKVMINEVNIEQIRKIGSEENHIKISFEQHGAVLDGIGFHLGHIYEEVTPLARLSAVGKLSINEWNGHCKPQLIIEDVGINHWQLFDWRNVQKLNTRLKKLPKEKRVYIAFQQETLDNLKLEEYLDEIILYEDTSKINFGNKFVVLLDLPPVKNMLYDLFNGQIPERIYAVFFQQETHFFSTMPTREHFKWFYGFLLKQKEFNLNRYGNQLATHKGWSKDTVEFMSQVFFELDFVTIKNGLIHLNQSISKKDLDESKTYRKKMNQSQLENEFLYSSYKELKQWFEKTLVDTTKPKETVK